MKKLFKFFSLALAIGTVACGFAACSSDDDDDKTAVGTITVDGKTYTMSHVGWYADSYEGSGYQVQIVFSDKELWTVSPGDRWTAFMILVPSSSPEIPTGTFAPEDYYLTFMADYDPYETTGAYFEGNDEACSDLTITKSGSGYTIEIEKVGFITDDHVSNVIFVNAGSFLYTGGIESWNDKINVGL